MASKPDWRKSLHCKDSKELIKRIPDNSIDFIFTDPPYNIGKHSTGNIPLPGRAAMNNDVADWDWVDFNPEEWADEFVRILKPAGNLFVFTSYNQLGRWYQCLDNRFDTSNFMIWHKRNPAPKIFKAGFLNSCEMIFTCWNKKHTWNFKTQAEMHNFVESPICMRPERLKNPKHPAQKPISILKHIIEIASNENDIIFDPFMGVGSVGVAALQLNRKYIGVEIKADYFNAAKKRIEEEMAKDNTNPENILSEPAALYGSANCDNTIDFNFIIKNELSTKASTDKGEVSKALKPLLKWAGGKEKELKYILPNLPKNFNNYYEPFVGGGSVFTAIKADNYYINDASHELISFYRYVAEQNKQFFKYLNEIDNAWDNAGTFFKKRQEFLSLYLKYREGKLNKAELKAEVISICHKNANEITEILNNARWGDEHKLHAELRDNLYRKMVRMNVLEHEKHALPAEDISDNIETAIRSALYMYFRHLYNTKDIAAINSELHTALFLFIRNFAYSGMFRYNKDGDFNVPYGGIGYNSKTLQKKVAYYHSEALRKHLNKTQISNMDFEQFLKLHHPTENDFIFLDPPYDSEFSTYAKNEFTHKDQERLAHYMIHECRAQWMLVIKNTEFNYNLYNRPGINIRSFDKKYLVSFMNRNDKKVTHLLITNY